MEYPTTRAEAKRTGAKFYFTGTPCKHGHVALRKTKGACVECLRMEWQESNEKRKEYFRTAEAPRAAKQRYYERHKDAIIARARKQPADALRKYKKKYKEANPDVYRDLVNARRRRFRNATPKWVDAAQRKQIRALYRQAREMTRTLGVKYEVDHVIPLISPDVCGLHVLANLAIIPKSDNLAKSNSFAPD